VVPGVSNYEVAHVTLYKVHQRAAKTFQQGRAFLAGDAAHINKMRISVDFSAEITYMLQACCIPRHAATIEEIVVSIRRRTWATPKGERKEAWVVDYVDQHGHRHLKTFARKKDADAYHAKVKVDVRAGTHTADSRSITVAEAGKLWLEAATNAGLERATLEVYGQQLKFHIEPLIADVKLSQLTVPMARGFEDQLAKDRSPVMVRKVMRVLGAILADAQERGLVAQNVVRSLRRERRGKHQGRGERRQRGKLKLGVHIPTPTEIAAIVAHLQGPRRPLLLTAIFTGLRASELRGLRWQDIDLKRAVLHIRQRVDRYQKIGPLKSEAGERTVPLPPMLVNSLREWKLACPKGDLDLAFANRNGKSHCHQDIISRSFHPAQIAAGVVDARGRAKYSGLHALRHFYASWCINRRVDGGLELPLKLVQARLGHASIQMTADRYGHLFPSADDGAELAAAEHTLLNSR
jgi:integrase